MEVFLLFYLSYRQLAETTKRLEGQHTREDGFTEKDRQFAIRIRDLAGRAEFNEVRASLETVLPF